MKGRLLVVVLAALGLLLASLWWSYSILRPATSPEEMNHLQEEELRSIAEHTGQTSTVPGIYKPPRGFITPNLNTTSGR